MFGIDPMILAIIGLAAVAAAAVAYGVLYPHIEADKKAQSRINRIKAAETDLVKVKASRDRLAELGKRRKSMQESLKELEKKNAEEKKTAPVKLKDRLSQAGIQISETQFYIGSAILAAITLVAGFILTSSMDAPSSTGPIPLSPPLLTVVGAAFVMGIGLPRFALKFLFKRRMTKFIEEFPNSLDIMTRSLKSGLPLNDALRLIAQEGREPVRSAFRRVIDAQQMGLGIPEACARMHITVPLQEVKFFAIVIAIQAQAGGNLSEALGNLSRVLRDRKKMKAKVQALSMEAKASAVIIASLPFAVALLVSLTSPDYLSPLFHDPRGNVILLFSAFWMLLGILVMRKMINFDI